MGASTRILFSLMGGENAGIADAEAIMAVERHTEALVTAQIRRSCRMG